MNEHPPRPQRLLPLPARTGTRGPRETAPVRALRLTHRNGGPSDTADGVPGPGGSATCSPSLHSGAEGRLLQRPAGAVSPSSSQCSDLGRSPSQVFVALGGPWVPGQDSAGNQRQSPGERAGGTDGRLWSCPPPCPVLLPTRAPTPGLSWEGRQRSPSWVRICCAQPSAHLPLSLPDLCWPWSQHATPQAWALERAQPL